MTRPVPDGDDRPLLQNDAASSYGPEVELPPRPASAVRAGRGIAPLLALMLLVNLAASLYQLPLNRVIERRLCTEYYEQHPGLTTGDVPIDESLCKVDSVQQSLAKIQGVMETAWVFGDFVMTIPLGYLAERYGRRNILVLNLVPRMSMLVWAVTVGHFDRILPTKAIIASPFLSVFGGDCVFNSLVYALAAELTDDNVVRASYFGYMSSVSYVVALLGPALASATMGLLIYLPFCIGMLLLVHALLAIARLPDMGKHHELDDGERHLSSPLLKAMDPHSSLWSSTRDRLQVFRSILSSHPRNFMLLLTSFFLTSLASSDTKLLVQYISKRYRWTFASAGYLLSAKAIVNFTLLAVVMPRFLRTTRADDPDIFNLVFSKTCLAVSIVGALGIGFSATMWLLVPSLLVYALGSALPVFTMSLLKSRCMAATSESRRDVSEVQDNIVFSIVMLVKTIGSLVGAPLMAFLWVKGIALGNVALGMPYFVSSGCYVAALVIFYRIRVHEGPY